MNLLALGVQPVGRGRLVLVGCGRAKALTERRACELYTGSVFCARRVYAERSGSPWAILSAFYGVVNPVASVEPYDMTIADFATWNAKTAWAMGVWRQLGAEAGAVVEVHAGERYFLPLHDTKPEGVSLEWPVEGLTQGKLLQYYKQLREGGK